MSQRTTTHLAGVVQGYEISRALCRSGGGEIVPSDPTCVVCQRLYRMANPMVDKALAARLLIDNPLNLPGVVIFHSKGVPPRAILELFDERLPLTVVHERNEWETTDFLVYSTGGLTAQRERFAARLGALIVILPEATDYLVGQIAVRTARGEDVRLFLPYPNCENER